MSVRSLIGRTVGAVGNNRENWLYWYRFARSLRDHKAYVPPWRVQVEITNRCNLRCVMCDRWRWGMEDGTTLKDLGTDLLCRLFDELSALGVREVRLTGGEPMLRDDFAFLVDHLNRLGLRIAVITNGTWMNSENAQSLAKAKATVQFSVDGCRDTHDAIRGIPGTFVRTMEGIRALNAARGSDRKGCEILVNYTVQKRNLGDIASTHRAAHDVGVDTVLYNIIHGRGDTALGAADLPQLGKNIRVLQEIPTSSNPRFIIGDVLMAFIDGTIPAEDVEAGWPVLSLFRSYPVPCLAAYRSSFIDGAGRVFPCCYCYLDNAPYQEFEAQRKKYLLGNIHEAGFAAVWRGESGSYAAFRESMDPVNLDAASDCCGQCYEYFSFRKGHEAFLLLKKARLMG